MSDQMVSRILSCPICEQSFTLYSPKSRTCQLIKRDPDFCPYYQGINPLFYQIWVCPHCSYASYKDHWSDVSSREKSQIELLIKQSTERMRFDFTRSDRNLFAALLSYQLAYRCYTKRRNAGAFLLGNIQLRLAWLCRYGNDLKRERIHLETARIHFQKAYQHDAGKNAASKMAFLIGEIHRRAGNNRDALEWLMQAKKNCDVKGEIYRLANHQLFETQEAIHFMQAFGKVDFLQPLSKDLLSLLATHTQRRRMSQGQIICRQGEAGDSLFIILKGQATVHLNTLNSTPVSTLKEGEFFGEMSLLTGQPRIAHIVAATDGELLEIPKIAFRTVLVATPETAATISQIITERLAENERYPAIVQPEPQASPRSKTGFLKRIMTNYDL